MSDSINALIGAQRNAAVIDSLANPPQINVLGSITRAADAAKSVMGMRALQAHQAWNDALAAATDKTSGVIDYPGALKAFSGNPNATYGMQEAATGASGLQNDQVTRGHYHLGILQGLFGGIDENMPPAQLRKELNATLDRGKALGLSPTDVETERSAIPADDAALPGYVRQFRFALSSGAEQAGYGGGYGGMTSAFLHETIEVPDPDNPGQKMAVVRGSALGAPGFPPVPRANTQTRAAATTAPAATNNARSATTAPPDPSNINPGYDQGFKPKGAPAAAPAPAAAVTSAPTAIPSSASTPPASTGAPSATVSVPHIVVPSATSGGTSSTTTPPPPANYGGPPAAGAGAPGAASVVPPAVTAPAPSTVPPPRGVPTTSNVAPASGITLASLNPFHIGSAEAQTFRGPGAQAQPDIDAYNAATKTVFDQRQNIISGESALEALKQVEATGPGTSGVNAAKSFMIAHGIPGWEGLDQPGTDAYQIARKNMLRFAQGNGSRIGTDLGLATQLESNVNPQTLLKSVNRHILVQDVGIARQKLAQTLTAPPGGRGQSDFGNGMAEHVKNFPTGTDWHAFSWDLMSPDERGAYLRTIQPNPKGAPTPAFKRWQLSMKIADEKGLWSEPPPTAAPNSPPATTPPPRAPAPTTNLLTPPP